jgi:hypothetical protein
MLVFQGMKTSKESGGNISGTRLTVTDIICKGFKNPENACYSAENVEKLGRLQKKAMKVGRVYFIDSSVMHYLFLLRCHSFRLLLSVSLSLIPLSLTFLIPSHTHPPSSLTSLSLSRFLSLLSHSSLSPK